VFCSWSGGKDCALALHEAILAGARPRSLITMMAEGGDRSRSHGLHRSLLEAQAEAVGLPIRFASAGWSDYEQGFTSLVMEATAGDVTTGIFGDIDIEDHRGWVERVCGQVGVEARLPLWQWDRRRVVERILGTGFEAMIVAVREGVLPESLLGRVIDADVLAEIEAAGADLAGEQGEYHSVVVDGPLFERPLAVTTGGRSLRDGVWFTDLRVPPRKDSPVRR
jgi:uncharacterized protein (TIGR00290 family)